MLSFPQAGKGTKSAMELDAEVKVLWEQDRTLVWSQSDWAAQVTSPPPSFSSLHLSQLPHLTSSNFSWLMAVWLSDT